MITKVGNLRNLTLAERQKRTASIVDRRTQFGNPFKNGSRDSQCDRYQAYFDERIIEDEDFKTAVLLLKGQTLYCWCAPKRCHAETIANWLNEQTDSGEGAAPA